MKEARRILSAALKERAPATAEAIAELPLTGIERRATKTLATLLRAVDMGTN